MNENSFSLPYYNIGVVAQILVNTICAIVRENGGKLRRDIQHTDIGVGNQTTSYRTKDYGVRHQWWIRLYPRPIGLR